jgi:nicotinate-nucleotide adenylyltransferase
MPSIGVFGGTFDPPHVGHLLSACEAAERVGLDRVLWVPAATQPFKQNRVSGASAADRLAMVRRTIAGVPGHALDTLEVDRGGVSYMVDTLRELHARDPDADWVLLLGRDAAAAIDRWREPARLRELARLVVMERAGEVEAGSLVSPRMQVVATRRVDVSSSEIRQRVASGKTIRGFVTDAVADYIATTGLYRLVAP